MPYKKKNYKKKKPRTYKKKAYKKKKPNLNYITTLPRGIGLPYPPQLKTWLTWSDNFVWNVNTAAPDTFAYQEMYFRGASPWDPEYSATPHQNSVADWSRLRTLYGSYQVLATSIQVDMMPGAVASNTNQQRGSMLLYSTPYLPNTPNYLRATSQPDCQLRTLNVYTGGKEVRAKSYKRISAMFGISEEKIRVLDLFSSFSMTQNPSFTPYWVVGLRNNNTTSPLNATIQVKIMYHVKLYSPVVPDYSVDNEVTNDSGPTGYNAIGVQSGRIDTYAATGEHGVGPTGPPGILISNPGQYQTGIIA